MSGPARDLLGAYALGAVDARQRREVEAAVARDPQMQRELDELLATVAAMDHIAVKDASLPGSGLWRRIEAEISTRAPEIAALPVRRRRRPGWITGLAAVTAVVLISVLTARVAQLSSHNRELRSALEDPVGVAVDRAVASGSSSTVSLGTAVSAVVQSDGVGYVMAQGLPALEPGRTYQLWAIVDGEILSAGVMGPDPGVVPFQMTGNLEGLAITDEVAGGVVTSQNDPVAVWIAET